ncbi:MAG TPA: hypothetical protein P5161_04510 [Eubacteriales bacterium]|mgnify:CR=1 FL=1|jgi:flavodoxin|nr:hypothetical protein [Eubacteriales bacterium]HRU84979.1 hypothetical protein [Eubacteriales bacterium]
MKSVICVYYYHHNNTEKIANAIAVIFDAEIKNPHELEPENLTAYDLIPLPKD